MYEKEIIENLREFSTKYLYEDQKLSETCFRAADAIEELQKPKWIPVTESLPDAHKNVLCCGSKGGQFVGWVSNHVANGKALAFVHGGYGRLITHWMPLPEPPKDGE